jgi:hypothetical protein
MAKRKIAPMAMRAMLDERYNLSAQIPEAERPVVFVGPHEHHSNELPWRESIADVVVIGEDADGHIDLADLERQLDRYAQRPRGTLLLLYAELADAEAAAHREAGRRQLRRARDVLLWEHLWSWAPAYLTAVGRLGTPSLGQWAELTLRALAREARQAAAPAALALALRAAPAALGAASSVNGRTKDRGDGLLGALLAPARSGVVLTREDLREAASVTGVGYRLGERRYTLEAMLSQDAAATLGWLSDFARRWAGWHAGQQPAAGPDPRHWWADRAARTAATLKDLQSRLVTAG